MNESITPSNERSATPVPPPIPAAPPGGEPLTPVSSVSDAVDALLRNPGRLLENSRLGSMRPVVVSMLLLILVGGAVYGTVMGSFSGGRQLWLVPLKVVGGILVSALICLPSLYVFGGLAGSKARLAHVAGLIGAMCALFSLLLLGLAPISWVFSESTTSVEVMGALHLAAWAIAFGFGCRLLLGGFRQLDGSSGLGLKMWMVLFLAVNLQMTTALRPLLGTSEDVFPKEKKLFLAHWFESLK